MTPYRPVGATALALVLLQPSLAQARPPAIPAPNAKRPPAQPPAPHVASSLIVRCRAPSKAGAGPDVEKLGAAVLLRDFRPEAQGELLLLTAFHVVDGCESIELGREGEEVRAAPA